MSERFTIQSDVEGVRLDVFLSQKLSLPRSKVKNIIEAGCVRIGSGKVKASTRVKKGILIEGVIPEEEPLAVEPQMIPLQILYEDEFLMVINKPAGLVVHPSFGHKNGTLVNAIAAYLKLPLDQKSLRPGIVHRLDKDTTGAIVVAKNSEVQEKMSAMFKERKVKKVYRAIVWGTMKEKEGQIVAKIGRHPKDRKRMAVVKNGREAITEYRVINELDGFTYVEVYPHTGRTHQIRVHFSYIGHPIVGDPTYGKRIKNCAERPLLHALSLEFPHPVKGEKVSVLAPEPKDIKEFIEKHLSERTK